ncbi:MAG: hypothetical protein R6V27_13750 [Balneolaceae bacterium]
MSVIFVFIDGVGVGEKGEFNPVADSAWQSLSHFTGCKGVHSGCEPVQTDSILYRPIDANLGVDGLPQSGTGQTTLFSGVNASEIAGKHYGPFPYSTTKYLLEEESLFHKVVELGFSPTFMNAYPDIFFKKAEKRDRWTATTLMTRSAGVRLNSVEDIVSGEAVTAEITQSVWKEQLGLNVEEITPETAAERLLSATKTFDLVLYEYYLTDKAGHSMDQKFAEDIRQTLDPFLSHVVETLGEEDTLVITSDHGNLEDLSIKTHTRNPVPLFVKGNTKPFRSSESIADVTPSILKILNPDS